MSKQSIRHDGEEVQIRVWIPAEMYAGIAARSEELGQSKAAITRDLLLGGMRAEQQTAQELDHLERLTYKAALESLAGAELFAVLLKHLFAGEDVDTKLKAWRNEAQRMATAQLKRYLSASAD